MSIAEDTHPKQMPEEGPSAAAGPAPDTGLLGLAMLARFHGLAADPDQLAHQFKAPGKPFGVAEILLAAHVAAGFKTNALATFADEGVNLVGELVTVATLGLGGAERASPDYCFHHIDVTWPAEYPAGIRQTRGHAGDPSPERDSIPGPRGLAGWLGLASMGMKRMTGSRPTKVRGGAPSLALLGTATSRRPAPFGLVSRGGAPSNEAAWARRA